MLCLFAIINKKGRNAATILVKNAGRARATPDGFKEQSPFMGIHVIHALPRRLALCAGTLSHYLLKRHQHVACPPENENIPGTSPEERCAMSRALLEFRARIAILETVVLIQYKTRDQDDGESVAAREHKRLATSMDSLPERHRWATVH